MEVRDQIKTLPTKPGVYQFFDAQGEIIYVGKAKSLKHRVSSYFANQNSHSGKTRVMVRKICNIEFIVVDSELDALLLENNLIKKYQPRYNILLKDDKTYPWLCIKNEPFPRIFSTRNRINDGSEYYGPYASVRMLNTLLALIRQIYYLRTCNYDLSPDNIAKRKYKVCLEYHIGNCKGPCEGKQSLEEYGLQIDEIRQIIKGNINSVIAHLKHMMNQFAENLEFEKAQFVKEKMELLRSYQSKSTVVNRSIHNVDVFSVISDPRNAYVNYMKIVDGAVIQSHTMSFRKRLEETDETLLELAITEMHVTGHLAKEILVPSLPETTLPGISFVVPQRGDKARLLELSARNARYFMLDKHKQERLVSPEKATQRVLEQMQKDLRLSELPRHIECFDNSNIQGTNPVAACVVFKNAKPSKKDYRHFNIKTVSGPDDFASMREVVYRRYSRLLKENEPLPQLIVIDGGKGQLGAALESLDDLGLRGKIAIVGIAKRLEEIYYPGDPLPLYIDKKSESLRIIQQLRNEAHRFGITHHRNKRSKAAINSELNNINGIGPATVQMLLRKFKSVKNISTQSVEELSAVAGRSKAEKIYAHFHPTQES